MAQSKRAPRGCAIVVFLLLMIPVAIVAGALGVGSKEPPPPAFDVAKIRDYLDENFAGTLWYSSVKRFEAPGGSRLNVYTDLYPDAEGKVFALDICRKILVNVRDKGVTEVAVFGQGDKFLARHP